MFPDPDLGALTAVAVYAVVWGFLFAECGLLLGFLLPGDTILFGAGLLAASPSSDVSLWLLVAGSFVAAVAGNEVGYRTGRRYGRGWLERRESGRAAEQLRRTERFYERYGWFSVVVARWIPWVRTFTPVVAGTAAMRHRSYTSANVVGALSWAVALPIVGYVAYQYPVVRTVSFAIAGVFVTVSLVGLAVLLVRDAVRRRRGRAEQRAGEPPAGRPDGGLSGDTSS
ncbi:MAG: DedA family protein [Frankiales bacterium]|nr:DedA family protein [Frankiales bacterium]